MKSQFSYWFAIKFNACTSKEPYIMWLLSEVDVTNLSIKRLGILFSALGACRSGMRRDVALTLLKTAINNRKLWLDYITACLQGTLPASYDWLGSICDYASINPGKRLKLASHRLDDTTTAHEVWNAANAAVALHPICCANQAIIVLVHDGDSGLPCPSVVFGPNDEIILAIESNATARQRVFQAASLLVDSLNSVLYAAIDSDFSNSEAKQNLPTASFLVQNIGVRGLILSEVLLGLVYPSKEYDSHRVSQLLGVSEASASYDLSHLVNEGVLEFDGNSYSIASLSEEFDLKRTISWRVDIERHAYNALSRGKSRLVSDHLVVINDSVSTCFETLLHNLLQHSAHDTNTYKTILESISLIHGEEIHLQILAAAGVKKNALDIFRRQRHLLMKACPSANSQRHVFGSIYDHRCIVEACQYSDEEELAWIMRRHLIFPYFRFARQLACKLNDEYSNESL